MVGGASGWLQVPLVWWAQVASCVWLEWRLTLSRAMPTYYEAMYAGGVLPEAEGGMEDVDDEVQTPLRTPERRTPSGVTPSSGERSGETVSHRGKGVGGDSGRGGGPTYYHIGSDVDKYGGDSSWEHESNGSRWSSWSGSYENWSWASREPSWEAYYGSGRSHYSNWEWVKPSDGWQDWHGDRARDRWGEVRDSDHGVCQEDLVGQGGSGGVRERCEEVHGEASPVSMPAARDVSGTLPSGEVSTVGHEKDRRTPGDMKHGKVSSSYPPVFRAKPGESFKEWKRAVGFWLGGEAGTLPAELIGPRLMVQLRDRAGQLVHHLSNEDVNTPTGMQLVMSTLEKSPLIRQLDKHRIDQHRKRLMSLRRLPHESIESYVTRGQLYRTQLVALDEAMQMGECFFIGHLLDGARLTRKDKVMIKTKAGIDREEEVVNAMVELAPELEGEPGFPIGGSEPNIAARQGEELLVQRGEKYGLPGKKEVNMVDYDNPFGEELFDVEEEDGHVEEEMDPPELVHAAHEAFAMHHKAKQRIMEIKKLRQYFRKPDPDERRRMLQEKMKTSPCHRCGQLGHWSRECPQKSNGTGLAVSKPSGSSPPNVEDEWSTLVALCKQPQAVSAPGAYKERFAGVAFAGVAAFQSLWCSQELHLRVIVDLGCVKSVVGVEWMNSLVKEWKKSDRWFRVQPEDESFQFGNGESLRSRYNVQFVCVIAGCTVVLGMSVVSGKCPPLLSRQACTQLGLKIDCGTHAFSSHIMGVRNYGMSQATNGHYLLPISEFASVKPVDIPEDFCLASGQEASVVCKAAQPSDVAAAMLESVNDHRDHASISPDVVLIDPGSCGQPVGEGEAGAMQALRGDGPSCSPMPHDRGDRGERRGESRDASGHGLLGANQEAAHSNQVSPGTSQEDHCCNGDAHRQAFDLGLGCGAGCSGPHRGRDPDDQQEEGEGGNLSQQEGDGQSSDRRASGLPQLVAGVVSGGCLEHGVLNGFKDASVPVEEVGVAAACESSCGAHDGSAMEEEPSLVSSPPGARSGCTMGTLRSHETEAQRSGNLAYDVKPWEKTWKLQRGDTQRLKKGVGEGLRDVKAVDKTAQMEGRYVLLEIYAGTARLSHLANTKLNDRWVALSPIDILYGHDLKQKHVQEKVLALIDEELPDLVTLAMPCGPWSSWMGLVDPAVVEAKRTEDMPLWRFARKVWDKQLANGSLALSENPLGSDGLKLTFMEARPSLHRARIAQCMFGLCDVISGMPHQKLTALDVTTVEFAMELEKGGKCMHQPGEHQPLEGQVKIDDKWWNRSMLAGAWPEGLCRHILRCAEKTLKQLKPVPAWSLSEPAEEDDLWEMPNVNAVSSGQIPEETMRREMQAMGGSTDRYGYITFEGEGQQVPRRIRAAVSHLHVTLGHLANERLVRMLMISGGGAEVLKAARNLKCQVCAMVQPPRDAPQAAYGKPQNFNTRVSGDTFFIWDIKNVKYGVVHFIDELTDFHVADCHVKVDSNFAADVLRDQWYGIFGPPDVLLTDSGMEFAGAVETLNDLMGVLHENVPEGAKWRLGHAERHGGILKLMLLKMVKGLALDGLDDVRTAVTAACAAKNRLCNHGGISPLQAVTGRNSVIPASLMTQICSGKMKFVLNQDLDREECLRRAERIRQGAIESFHWLDAHQSLRRALATKSRPPRLELLKEGAVVYIYDPPANRRGLARRLQDNVSWHGPAVVVCVERDRAVPHRVWVRLKGRVKAVPLEKIRLATTEELMSAEYITEALNEVQKELTSGRLQVEEALPLEDAPRDTEVEVSMEADGTASSSSSSTASEAEEQPMELEGEKETERMRLEKRLLCKCEKGSKRQVPVTKNMMTLMKWSSPRNRSCLRNWPRISSHPPGCKRLVYGNRLRMPLVISRACEKR